MHPLIADNRFLHVHAEIMSGLLTLWSVYIMKEAHEFKEELSNLHSCPNIYDLMQKRNRVVA